jgi:trans-2,3-dihydro-3-hydroxyanthranilate isomerase
MLSLPYLQTSVFVDSRYAFGGNQLATFWDATVNAKLTQEEMQGIALEMHFSETTFLFSSKLPQCDAKVRIFTPGQEIPFAGHPTLGTAFVMKHSNLIDGTIMTATLELGIGAVPVTYLGDNSVQMTQPAPQFLKEWSDKDVIAKAIGLTAAEITDAYPMQYVATGTPFLILPLVSLSAVQRAQPHGLKILGALENQPSQKILIFSTEVVNAGSDVHVRMFAPDVGVLEDPATGSAAGPLAAYLEYHQVLQKPQREQIIIEQGYELQRPSQLLSQVLGEDQMKQVLVSGQVKLIAEGVFYLG